MNLKQLSENADNQSTKKSTFNWIRVYQQWNKERNVYENLVKMDEKTLEKILTWFYGETQTKQKVLQTRFSKSDAEWVELIEKGSSKNIYIEISIFQR